MAKENCIGAYPACPQRFETFKCYNYCRCLGGRFWCIKDICGLVCVFFTWMLILYAEWVFNRNRFIDFQTIFLHRFVVLRVILYSHPNKIFSVINGIIFQVWLTITNYHYY